MSENLWDLIFKNSCSAIEIYVNRCKKYSHFIGMGFIERHWKIKTSRPIGKSPDFSTTTNRTSVFGKCG